MKKSFLLFCLTALVSLNAIAKESLQIAHDSLQITNLQRRVTSLETTIFILKSENTQLQELCQKQIAHIDSLDKIQCQQVDSIEFIANKLENGLQNLSEANSTTNDTVGSLNNQIKTRTWFGIFLILLTIVFFSILLFMLRKKTNNYVSSFGKLKSAQENLEITQKSMMEESVKIDNRLLELLKKQASIQSQTGDDTEPDHSLVKMLGNNLSIMETNLYIMGRQTRGYNLLMGAIRRIKDNLKVDGYEIIRTPGENYVEGMILDNIEFKDDETIPLGSQIISSVKKPQINYNGHAIQYADIVVSQNI